MLKLFQCPQQLLLAKAAFVFAFSRESNMCRPTADAHTALTPIWQQFHKARTRGSPTIQTVSKIIWAAKAHQAPQFCVLATQEEPGQAIPAALQNSHQVTQQRTNARLGYTHQLSWRAKITVSLLSRIKVLRISKLALKIIKQLVIKTL